MTYTLPDLLRLFDLEAIEENLFRGQNGPGSHVFGGQVLGQAIVAAARTVDGRRLHSLHSYFLRPGNASRPILFDVDRIRDGTSFTTRRVVGIQAGRAIFNMSASFQVEEIGLEHQIDMPEVPDFEGLPSDGEYFGAIAETDPSVRRFAFRFEVIDSRQVEGLHMLPREAEEAHGPRKHTWVRMKGRLPDDPVLHQAALAYLSDMDFMSTAMLPHGPDIRGYDLQGASLDHSMWFHAPVQADEWLLFSKESPAAAASRGFVRGSFFDRRGRLVASCAQECLLRLREKEHGIAG